MRSPIDALATNWEGIVQQSSLKGTECFSTPPHPTIHDATNTNTATAYVEWDEETKLSVGIIPGIRGVHTQAASLDELRENRKEFLELCLGG
jgi:hypothetical protein